MRHRIWLYPVIKTQGMDEAEYSLTRYEMDRKDDLKSWVSSIYIVSFDTGPCYNKLLINGSERDVLTEFWDWMKVVPPELFVLAGWHLSGLGWPKILNRSLANGLSVPCLGGYINPERRWPECTVYDLHRVYMGGAIKGERRELALHDVLQLWTGKTFPTELMAAAEPTMHVPGYIKAMESVAQRYCDMSQPPLTALPAVLPEAPR